MISIFALGILFGIISMVTYGFTDLISSLLTKRYNITRLTFWYFVLSGIILGAISFLFFKLPKVSLLQVILLAFTSLVSVVALLSFFKGLKIGKLSIIAPISGAWSIITVLIGVMLFGESLTVMQSVGVALAILGTVLTSFKMRDLLAPRLRNLAPGSDYAIITMLLWGVFYAGIGILSKQLGWIWPVFVTTILSAVILLVYALFNGTDLSFPSKGTKLIVLWMIIGTIAFSTYGISANYGNVSLVSPIVASAPFIAVIAARLLLKEKLEVNQIIGIALILVGIFLIAY